MQELPKVQGTGGGCVYYTGAWCGYGFHEDGMRSAVAALHAMGLQVQDPEQQDASSLRFACRNRTLMHSLSCLRQIFVLVLYHV